jgi:hypothetical protein
MAGALQKYLWPFYRADGSASAAHVVSLCVLVNEKFREGVPAWDAITGVVTSEGEIEVTDRCGAVRCCNVMYFIVLPPMLGQVIGFVQVFFIHLQWEEVDSNAFPLPHDTASQCA